MFFEKFAPAYAGGVKNKIAHISTEMLAESKDRSIVHIPVGICLNYTCGILFAYAKIMPSVCTPGSTPQARYKPMISQSLRDTLYPLNRPPSGRARVLPLRADSVRECAHSRFALPPPGFPWGNPWVALWTPGVSLSGKWSKTSFQFSVGRFRSGSPFLRSFVPGFCSLHGCPLPQELCQR